MGGEMKNIAEVCIATTASICYSYFISSNIPKGKLRLLSLFPVFILFTLLPCHLIYAFPASVTAFFLTWLANFKLALFAFGLGPLSLQKRLPLFIAFACFPVRNYATPRKGSVKPKKIPLNLATETVLFSILIGVLSEFKETIHLKIKLAMYCCLVFLLVDILIFISNAFVKAFFGLELEPPSDEPYLSTSLQEFWGKRWNLMVTNTLRQTVYKPVRSGLEPLLGWHWAALPAVLSAFLVSGLMHELLFYYVMRVWPTWEMTGFFVLQGLCVVIEVAVKAAVGGRCRVPAPVAVVLTVGFVVVTGYWLFFPPLIRNGADLRVIEEFGLLADYMIRCIIAFSDQVHKVRFLNIIGSNGKLIASPELNMGLSSSLFDVSKELQAKRARKISAE